MRDSGQSDGECEQMQAAFGIDVEKYQVLVYKGQIYNYTIKIRRQREFFSGAQRFASQVIVNWLQWKKINTCPLCEPHAYAITNCELSINFCHKTFQMSFCSHHRCLEFAVETQVKPSRLS